MKSVRDALGQPWGRLFRVERVGGRYAMGDPGSHFNGNTNLEHLTFDVSNNKVLANVSAQGSLKAVTIYRDSYRACCHPAGWSGVWLAKDSSSYGPYSYAVEVDGSTHDLATVEWDFRTGLLDNTVPVTELEDPEGRFTVRLVTWAPVSGDGSERLRGVVHGLQIENSSARALRGHVRLPEPFGGERATRGRIPWATFDPFEFEIALGDGMPFRREVPFDLAPGEGLWVPTILYMPGEPTVAEVDRRGALAWLLESLRYYRRILGRLETPSDPWLAEFHERQVMGALGSVAMSGSGRMAGSNWGSYPATRQIWAKDCYHSCLPFMELEPALAREMILWFDEFGARHAGNIVEGGIAHSLGLSVAGVVLAGLYYERTGDAEFFVRRPEFKGRWGALLEEVIASRRAEGVWLFPTRFISDGAVECDWHTGSNVCAWRALAGYARLLEEAYADPAGARRFADAAARVRDAILERTVVDGPFGRQFIEGAYSGGRPPLMISDGEESDATLMPFYGLLPYDDAAYLNYMRFSMTPWNAIYHPGVRAISWAADPALPLGKRVPSTAPGYNKGVCAAADRESLFGERGYVTEIRRVTDADGSVWWWPYGEGGAAPEYGKVTRGVPGKSGWFAGVYATVFRSRFLGVSYDAPLRRFRFAPLKAVGSFTWNNLPAGEDRFDVAFASAEGAVRAAFTNPNDHAVELEVLLPVEGLGEAPALTLDGEPVRAPKRERHLGLDAVRVSAEVGAGRSVEVRAVRADARRPGG